MEKIISAGFLFLGSVVMLSLYSFYGQVGDTVFGLSALLAVSTAIYLIWRLLPIDLITPPNIKAFITPPNTIKDETDRPSEGVPHDKP